MASKSTNKNGGNAPLIVIVGETASGKSDLALRIAQAANGSIIGADSRTVYTGMDIGTAKPSAAERESVPHYCFDIAEPSHTVTAAEFKEYAVKAIDETFKNGRLPIMVGGSGMYVDSVIFDYSFEEKANNELRNELSKLSHEALIERAQAERLNISDEMLKNKRHLMRQIETGGAVKQDKQLRNNTIVIGLSLSRSQLRARIEQRVELMFKAGLRREVEELARSYGTDSEAFTGIGYREFIPYFAGEVSMGQVKRAIVKNTINILAKKQRTWFKRNPHITWFSDPDVAFDYVMQSEYVQSMRNEAA